MDPKDVDAFFRFLEGRGLSGDWLTREGVGVLPRGAIVGLVEIVDCIRASTSPWFEGPYGFVLQNPRAISPIPCRGAQKLFDLPAEIRFPLAQCG